MKRIVSLTACIGLLVAAGCSQKNSSGQSSEQESANIDGSKYLLDSEPEGAVDVIAARKTVKDGDDVVVVGRIGGGENPWVKERAAFTIVDGSLKACSDDPNDKCETPWDYCCATDKLPSSTAVVRVVDENGNLVKADARKLLKVKELSTVVVKGKAKRVGKNNLTILATGIFIKKK